MSERPKPDVESEDHYKDEPEPPPPPPPANDKFQDFEIDRRRGFDEQQLI